MSLIYIGLVVLLHIYAKLGATKPVNIETPSSEPRVETENAQGDQTEQADAEPEAEAPELWMIDCISTKSSILSAIQTNCIFEIIINDSSSQIQLRFNFWMIEFERKAGKNIYLLFIHTLFVISNLL